MVAEWRVETPRGVTQVSSVTATRTKVAIPSTSCLGATLDGDLVVPGACRGSPEPSKCSLSTETTMDKINQVPHVSTETTSCDEIASEVDRSADVPAAEGGVARDLRQPEQVQPEFSEFYVAQMPRLIGFVMTLGADAQSATDIAQESMVTTWRYWDGIDISPHAYVRKVASRAWARLLTKNTYMETSLPEVVEEDSERSSPLHFVIRQAEHRAVLNRIRRLPLRQRQVMAWTFDGYKPDEIADILDINSDAVRASLYKARKTLRQIREENQ